MDKLGIPRTTFYRWYDKYLDGGVAALEDKAPKPSRVWNRIPDDTRRRIVGKVHVAHDRVNLVMAKQLRNHR